MFQQPFNFAMQRTAIQAVGWYLFFLLLAGLAGALAVLVAHAIAGAPLPLPDAVVLGAKIAPIFAILLGVGLLRARPMNVANVLVTTLASVFSFFAGFLGAGLFLAYLTTRPLKGALTA
jgi:hypothetical protein